MVHTTFVHILDVCYFSTTLDKKSRPRNEILRIRSFSPIPIHRGIEV